MLKEMSIRKIIATSTALLLLLVLYFIPIKPEEVKYSPSSEIVYESVENFSHVIYLIDSDDYVSRTKVVLNNSDDVLQKARDIIETLIVGGIGESKLPNGFRSIVPSGTEILGLELIDETIFINFNDSILEINDKYKERMIEVLIYSLTSIDGINNVSILVDGEALEFIPKSNIRLGKYLNRTFGINKQYNVNSFNDLKTVTIYYINRHDSDYYYVPVTKYINDKRDKIEIIIDELSGGPIYETNLMSFLSSNAELLNYQIKEKTINLEFNNYLYSDMSTNNILEEVIYSISLSISDNYDVDSVVFQIEDEKVLETVIKNIE